MSAIQPRTASWRLSFDRNDQLKAGITVFIFGAVFWNLLAFFPSVTGLLSHAWWYQSDWSHGPIIPLFSAYLVHTRWEQIRRTPIKYTWVGLIILICGLLAWVWAVLAGTFAYAKPLSMMLTLLGLIIFICGLPVMKHVWVPYLFLFYAIPLPSRLYFEITNPLRQWAAAFVTSLLSMVEGLHIERLGSTIHAVYQGQFHAIGVADACSGMRSTITMCALGTAVAFIYPRPWWQRLILVASCVPIATFCNFLRVLITCCLFIFVDEKYATGSYHWVLGIVMLGVAFAMFTALGWMLSHLVVETDEDEEDDESDQPSAAGTPA